MTTVLGVDFTSRPRGAKPLTVARGVVRRNILHVPDVEELVDYGGYRRVLAEPGRWTAAVDHPFGLPRAFVAAVGWPADWSGYVARAGALERADYRALVGAFTRAQPP